MTQVSITSAYVYVITLCNCLLTVHRGGRTWGVQGENASSAFSNWPKHSIHCTPVLGNDHKISFKICFRHDFNAIVHPLILVSSSAPVFSTPHHHVVD